MSGRPKGNTTNATKSTASTNTKTTVNTNQDSNTVINTQEISSVIAETIKTTVSEISKISDTQKDAITEYKLSDDSIITVKNNTCGELIYVNTRSGDFYRWNQHGDTCDIKISDLREMKNSQRTFYTKNKFSIIGCVNDKNITPEEIINFVGLTQYFKEDMSPDLYEVITNWTNSEIKEKIPNISTSCKQSLIVMLSTMIENDEIDSLSRIKAFEQALNVTFKD